MPKNTRKPVRRFVMHRVIPRIAVTTYRKFGNSWSYVSHRKHLFEQALADDRPVVGAFLHARTFQLLHYMSLPEHGDWVLMCSQSRDGELMARVEEGLGFQVVRGSSGGGGARALIEMIRAVKKNPGVGSSLAMDGSRGPRGVAQLGLLTLVHKTNGILLPVAASAESTWIYSRSWDRATIPKPRTKVHVLFGEPIDVPKSIDEPGSEKLRAHLERVMLDLHAEVDEMSGFRDTEPLQVRA